MWRDVRNNAYGFDAGFRYELEALCNVINVESAKLKKPPTNNSESRSSITQLKRRNGSDLVKRTGSYCTLTATINTLGYHLRTGMKSLP